jgi:hypothetical protein
VRRRSLAFMSRYFFHLTDGDLSLADDEVGEELDHAEAVRRHAMAVAWELSRNQRTSSLGVTSRSLMSAAPSSSRCL